MQLLRRIDMSSIATYLNQILRSVYGKDVRQAIHDAISQCYDDVNAPALQTEAMEAAVQAKIDAGEMAALTIADGTLTGAKLADGTIPTAKIADGAITMAKLSSDIDFDVETDTTLTQPGVPADAKAVGDVLAEAITGEALEDDETMKYVLSAKYDDFKLVNGYGYFDAKKLLANVVNVTPTEHNNKVFRISPTVESRPATLVDFTDPTKIFSPDFPAYKSLPWYNVSGMATYPEGYWYSKDPNPARTELYYTVPKSVYGSSASLGDFVFRLMDGSVGAKLKTANIREYDPATVISVITTGGSISTVTTDGVAFYRGFLTYTWSDLFDFARTNTILNRMYNNLGFCEEYTEYAKECVWLEGTTRIWYRVKADAVSAKTIDAIKDYLVNTRHLKFYYVAEEVTA